MLCLSVCPSPTFWWKSWGGSFHRTRLNTASWGCLRTSSLVHHRGRSTTLPSPLRFMGRATFNPPHNLLINFYFGPILPLLSLPSLWVSPTLLILGWFIFVLKWEMSVTWNLLVVSAIRYLFVGLQSWCTLCNCLGLFLSIHIVPKLIKLWNAATGQFVFASQHALWSMNYLCLIQRFIFQLL